MANGETVADIVREMRCDPSRQLASWEDTINTRRIVHQFLCNYADRIEAAFVRNNDEYNCQLRRLCEAERGLCEALRGLCEWLSDGIRERGSINPHWAKAMDALAKASGESEVAK